MKWLPSIIIVLYLYMSPCLKCTVHQFIVYFVFCSNSITVHYGALLTHRWDRHPWVGTSEGENTTIPVHQQRAPDYKYSLSSSCRHKTEIRLNLLSPLMLTLIIQLKFHHLWTHRMPYITGKDKWIVSSFLHFRGLVINLESERSSSSRCIVGDWCGRWSMEPYGSQCVRYSSPQTCLSCQTTIPV